MTVKVTKPEITSLREKLNELEFGKLPLDKIPAGSVVQVVQGVLRPSDNGGFFLTTTSTSFQSALLNASITPTSSSNKVLIMVAFQVYGGGRASIYQDGTTNLGDSNYGFARIQKGNGWHEQTIVYLHSPNTTSSVNYKLYGASDGATVYFGGDGDIPNTITLMEIAQ
jgi:hypothetical protein